MRFLTVSAFLTLFAFSAIASDFESRSTAPEYSGPSARIESGGMGGTEPMVTRRTPIGPSSADTGFDKQIEERGEKISNEMDRRRDEAQRIKEEHLLKTNE
jgi:hypothetical protein